MNAQRGVRYSSTLSLTPVVDGGEWTSPSPTALCPPPPGQRPGTHFIGRWVVPRAGLNGCGKSHPLPGFDPRTVYTVASLCTDYARYLNVFLRFVNF